MSITEPCFNSVAGLKPEVVPITGSTVDFVSVVDFPMWLSGDLPRNSITLPFFNSDAGCNPNDWAGVSLLESPVK